MDPAGNAALHLPRLFSSKNDVILGQHCNKQLLVNVKRVMEDYKCTMKRYIKSFIIDKLYFDLVNFGSTFFMWNKETNSWCLCTKEQSCQFIKNVMKRLLLISNKEEMIGYAVVVTVNNRPECIHHDVSFSGVRQPPISYGGNAFPQEEDDESKLDQALKMKLSLCKQHLSELVLHNGSHEA